MFLGSSVDVREPRYVPRGSIERGVGIIAPSLAGRRHAVVVGDTLSFDASSKTGAAPETEVDPLAELTQRVAESGPAGVAFAFLVGVVLGVSPVSLPSVPIVVATLSPGEVDDRGARRLRPVMDALPSVFAFVVGMDGVVAVAGYLFVEVTIALTRAAVVLHLVAAGVLGVLGVALLSRRTSLCKQARPLPPNPVKAFFFGIAFSVGGCPACGPIAIGLGAAAALAGGPLLAMLAIYAFVLGRTFVLLASASVGGRLLPTGGAVPWRRLDIVVGGLFLVAAGYYLVRLATGQVSTTLPGEPGNPFLP